MRTIDLRLFVALALVALSACVSVQSTRLGGGPIRPPVPPDRVAIYGTPAQVAGRYEEVALLSAAGDYAYTNEEQIYKKMREKAAALGANGVILDSVDEPTTGAKVAGFLIGTPAKRKGKAVAIFVADMTAK